MAVVTGSSKESLAKERLTRLRHGLNGNRLDAYLIPSVDEHINEYLPENRKRREWASGFTGSAGDFLVGVDEAWVFVDSRYHEQAGYEVATGCIHISRLGLDGEPSLTEKIKGMAEKKSGGKFRLGFDSFTLTVAQAQGFEKAFKHADIELVPVSGNLVDAAWPDAPAGSTSEVFAVPDNISGQSTGDKLVQTRKKLKEAKCDLLPVTKLDQVAWLFNLRGQDIPYNPVFIAYAILTADQALLFTDAQRITTDAQAALKNAGVTVAPYDQYVETLAKRAAEKQVLIAPAHTTQGTVHQVEASGGRVIEADHPVETLKAIKNAVEIEHMKSANLKASRGKIRAWHWLEQQLKAGNTVTEESFRQAIEGFYAEEEGFFGLSFNTISGAGANSSIVHYGTPDPNKKLEAGELFLIDSGCQFMGGTTDDTRTVIVGTPTALQKQRFTEVMKAHINCAMQQFPKGTEGARLDGITRATLWQAGLDYGHGTGHGVGAFLNVHEGPNGIHKLAAKPFVPGMITSIEPGFYEPGWGGIRLENLSLCVEIKPGWYGFEILNWIPFDKRLYDYSLLSPAQLDWLKKYHAGIVEKIAPTLNAEEAAWLKEMCAI